MNPVGTHGQGCLGPEEYSAVALAMQCNRDAVDAALTTDQAALNTYNNRPWLLATSAAAVTQSQTLTEWTFGTSWNGFQVFSLNTSGISVVSSGMALGSAALAVGNFPSGWWNIGGYCSYQPTGAVTNNTRRLMCIQVSHSVQFTNQFDTIVQTSFESNTGTDSMTANSMFFLDNAFSYSVILGFAHRNSGSTIQVNTGAKIWLTYLGSGVTI